jgi:hypothetical protein
LSPREKSRGEEPSLLPVVARERQVGFPASIAEFLLVFRLKARRRSTLSADILERAVRVVFITCKNWFSVTPSHHTPSHARKHD